IPNALCRQQRCPRLIQRRDLISIGCHGECPTPRVYAPMRVATGNSKVGRSLGRCPRDGLIRGLLLLLALNRHPQCALPMSAFGGKGGHPLGLAECLLMTRSGHRSNASRPALVVHGGCGMCSANADGRRSAPPSFPQEAYAAKRPPGGATARTTG